MRLPAELCKMQRKKRETDGFSKSTWMTPPGSHPTSGFGARHGLPKFFRHKKRRIVQNDAANWWTRRGSNPRPIDCEPIALPTELQPHFLFRHGERFPIALRTYASPRLLSLPLLRQGYQDVADKNDLSFLLSRPN